MKRKIGIFFGQGYTEEIKIYREAVKENYNLRMELVWEK